MPVSITAILKNKFVFFSSHRRFHVWAALLQLAERIALHVGGAGDDGEFHIPTAKYGEGGGDAGEQGGHTGDEHRCQQ